MRFALLLLLCLIAPAANADGFLGRLPGLGSPKQPTFLPPEQAFSLDVIVRDAHTLQANFRITTGYYLYRDKIRFEIKDQAVRITAVNLPKGEMRQDPNFGDTEVFLQSFQAEITLARSPVAVAESVTINATYQGCSELGLCYPPSTPAFRISLPDAKTGMLPPPVMTEAQPAIPQAVQSEGSKIAQLFKGGSFWLIVSFFFGAGLLLAFTPCVFPMVPILSGIIVGRGHKITICTPSSCRWLMCWAWRSPTPLRAWRQVIPAN